MSGYRDLFFQYNPGRRLAFKSGLWWQCVSCKRWFRKSDITVDHIIPRRKGGRDEIWNLQPMCKSCNSAKRERNTGGETAKALVGAAMHGQLGGQLGSIAGRKVKDALGIKYKRK